MSRNEEKEKTNDEILSKLSRWIKILKEIYVDSLNEQKIKERST